MLFADLSSFANLSSIIITILGILMTIAGIITSIYFFYLAQAEKPMRGNKTIDTAINILDIYRYPLEKNVIRKAVKNIKDALVSLLIFIISFIGYELFILISLTYNLAISTKNRKYLYDPPTVFTYWACFVVMGIGLIIFLHFYLKISVKKREIEYSHEIGSSWVMDHAIMCVSADFNYLLEKARWSLKQMDASIITVKSDYVEGILNTPPWVYGFSVLRATLKPDPDETGTFFIIIECAFAESRRSQFIKGRYINTFLDLMGSIGLEKLAK